VISGFSINSANHYYLWKVDVETGSVLGTAIPTTAWLNQLAYSLDGLVLYGVDNGQLVTVDTDTGVTTLVGDPGLSPFIEGLAFRPSDGELFAIDAYDQDRLVRLDPVNGGLLEVIGGLGVSGPYGLAFINLIPSVDHYEPDDNNIQATTILSGSPQAHSIIPATDLDWVKFTLSARSAVTIETSGDSTVDDTRMWLYDDNLAQIEFNDDSGTDWYSLIDRQCNIDALPAGIYYVKIDEYQNNNEIPSYQISLNITPCTSLGAGVHDDVAGAWTYTGDWGVYSGAGPYLDTLHYSTSVGDSAEVSFVGEQIRLTYTALVDRGMVDIFIDGEKVVTLNESGPGSWQQKWTSDPLSSGTHTLRLVHAAGGIVDIDALTVIGEANILTAGTYDDASGEMLFTTNWYTYAGPGPQADTLHFSISAGEAAQFSFSGEQFGFTYTQMSGRGVVDVYIDGVKATSVNEEGPGAWQQRWTSDPLSAGIHTVRLVHASGYIVDLDAIQVMSTATVLSAGSYDDGNVGLRYSTNWYTHSGAGPSAGTLHFAFSPGESVLFSFSGEQFKLTYTQMADRGVVDVYVDGVKVASIDESGTGAWQQTWTSEPLPAGNHNVRLVQAGAGVVDIDALEILATATILPAGTYDDGNAAWHYSTYWYTAVGAGYYAGTLHFSINPKDEALVSFSGRQIVLTYTEMSDRGQVDVYVDGVKVGTLDESGSGSYQKTWTSGVFAAGTHTVRLVHASGPITDIDAITVMP
jgi:hypothetical protein